MLTGPLVTNGFLYSLLKSLPLCFSIKHLPSIRFICVLSCSVVFHSATPWTLVRQVPLSMGFSRQECWSGCHFPLQEISQLRDQTHVCCIGRWILYHYATWVHSWDKTGNISAICNPGEGLCVETVIKINDSRNRLSKKN